MCSGNFHVIIVIIILVCGLLHCVPLLGLKLVVASADLTVKWDFSLINCGLEGIEKYGAKCSAVSFRMAGMTENAHRPKYTTRRDGGEIHW